jgi:hypothetical protein
VRFHDCCRRWPGSGASREWRLPPGKVSSQLLLVIPS